MINDAPADLSGVRWIDSSGFGSVGVRWVDRNEKTVEVESGFGNVVS